MMKDQHPGKQEGREHRPLQSRDPEDGEDVQDASVLARLREVEDPSIAEKMERLLGDADLNRRLQLSTPAQGI